MSITSNKVLVLFGPTAVGKTAALARLANDDRSALGPVVVISADALQVYRGMDIGTAKPTLAERAVLPHELVDIRDPDQSFSVAEFVRLADETCDRVLAAGAMPAVSGGTAYYIKAFLYGVPVTPPSDPEVRRQIQSDMELRGVAAMREELLAVDPVSASRIKSADLYRLSRAIEVYRCSGKPLSSYELPESPRARWNTLVLGMDRPRSELYARIHARVDAMIAAGLADEVSGLVKAGYGPDSPGMKAIGYREFLAQSTAATPSPVTGAGTDTTLQADMVAIAESIKLNTRHYAKRQLTFMRSIPGTRWFDADDTDGIYETVSSWWADRHSREPAQENH